MKGSLACGRAVFHGVSVQSNALLGLPRTCRGHRAQKSAHMDTGRIEGGREGVIPKLQYIFD